MANASNRPSVFIGLKLATRMWLLVCVVWLVGLAVMTPATIVVESAADGVFNRLPADFDPPPGDVAIMVARAAREIANPLVMIVVCGVFLSWVWTVLWHGGVARFVVWDAAGPVTVSKILGLGFGVWWRYFRLSLTALSVLFAALAAIWVPVFLGVKGAFNAMAEDRMVMLIFVGIVLAGCAKCFVWATTLRACWELAKPTSRSAIRAWIGGAAGVIHQPVSTLVVLVFLGLPEVLLAFAPMIAPVFFVQLRGTLTGDVFAVVAGLGSAYFLVALYASFAPISSLVVDGGRAGGRDT